MDRREFELPIEGSLSKLALLHSIPSEAQKTFDQPIKGKTSNNLKKKKTISKKNKNK